MKLEDLVIYSKSMDLGEKVWSLASSWDYFSQSTVGKQIVGSADSISANISEGFGRFHFRENINFCYYARGSLFETKTWLIKARNRKLIKESECNSLLSDLEDLGVRLNNYINTIGKSGSS